MSLLIFFYFFYFFFSNYLASFCFIFVEIIIRSNEKKCPSVTISTLTCFHPSVLNFTSSKKKILHYCAGISGIVSAAAAQQAGHEAYVLEQNADVGGVWLTKLRWNSTTDC